MVLVLKMCATTNACKAIYILTGRVISLVRRKLLRSIMLLVKLMLKLVRKSLWNFTLPKTYQTTTVAAAATTTTTAVHSTVEERHNKAIGYKIYACVQKARPCACVHLCVYDVVCTCVCVFVSVCCIIRSQCRDAYAAPSIQPFMYQWNGMFCIYGLKESHTILIHFLMFAVTFLLLVALLTLCC